MKILPPGRNGALTTKKITDNLQNTSTISKFLPKTAAGGSREPTTSVLESAYTCQDRVNHFPLPVV